MTDPDPNEVKAALEHIQSVEQITDDYKPYFEHGEGQVVAAKSETPSELTPTLPPEEA